MGEACSSEDDGRVDGLWERFISWEPAAWRKKRPERERATRRDVRLINGASLLLSPLRVEALALSSSQACNGKARAREWKARCMRTHGT